MNAKVLLGILFCNCANNYANNFSNELILIQSETQINISIQLDSFDEYNEIEILRTNDTNLGFDKIAKIYSIKPADNNLQFIDKTPIPNSINYYKISYLNQTISSIHSIYYAAYSQLDYSIYNDENSSTLFINTTDENAKFHFFLFDMSGKVLTEINEIQDTKISFDTNLLHHGFYFFQVYESSIKKLQGKIFIP